jgi:hypothetical protein
MHVFCVLYPNAVYGVLKLVDEHSTFLFVVGVTYSVQTLPRWVVRV